MKHTSHLNDIRFGDHWCIGDGVWNGPKCRRVQVALQQIAALVLSSKERLEKYSRWCCEPPACCRSLSGSSGPNCPGSVPESALGTLCQGRMFPEWILVKFPWRSWIFSWIVLWIFLALTLQTLPFLEKARGFFSQDKQGPRVFLFAEPLKSLEKREKTQEKARKIRKRKSKEIEKSKDCFVDFSCLFFQGRRPENPPKKSTAKTKHQNPPPISGKGRPCHRFADTPEPGARRAPKTPRWELLGHPCLEFGISQKGRRNGSDFFCFFFFQIFPFFSFFSLLSFRVLPFSSVCTVFFVFFPASFSEKMGRHLSRDPFCETPTFRGHSRNTSGSKGPKAPKDSCSRPGGSQRWCCSVEKPSSKSLGSVCSLCCRAGIDAALVKCIFARTLQSGPPATGMKKPEYPKSAGESVGRRPRWPDDQVTGRNQVSTTCCFSVLFWSFPPKTPPHLGVENSHKRVPWQQAHLRSQRRNKRTTMAKRKKMLSSPHSVQWLLRPVIRGAELGRVAGKSGLLAGLLGAVQGGRFLWKRHCSQQFPPSSPHFPALFPTQHRGAFGGFGLSQSCRWRSRLQHIHPPSKIKRRKRFKTLPLERLSSPCGNFHPRKQKTSNISRTKNVALKLPKISLTKENVGQFKGYILQSWVICVFVCVLGVVGHRGFTIFLTLPCSRTAKIRIWTLRIWCFSGPGFCSARHVLCGDASRLFLADFLSILKEKNHLK